MEDNKRYIIFGVGGFGREVLSCMVDSFKGTGINLNEITYFMDENPEYINQEINGVKVLSIDNLNIDTDELIIAVGDPKIRESIVKKLPKQTKYFTLIHPSAVISKWIEIGQGSIVTAGCILTCNIKIGDHAHLNLNTTIGHDCHIGDYFTSAPAANISGECSIGDNVYFGTASSIRQGLIVKSNTTIGMGAVVVKNISESGVYIGSPARKIKG